MVPECFDRYNFDYIPGIQSRNQKRTGEIEKWCPNTASIEFIDSPLTVESRLESHAFDFLVVRSRDTPHSSCSQILNSARRKFLGELSEIIATSCTRNLKGDVRERQRPLSFTTWIDKPGQVSGAFIRDAGYTARWIGFVNTGDFRGVIGSQRGLW